MTNEYPPYIYGGIGTFCYNLSNALAAAGVHVRVMAGCPPQEIRKHFPEPETLHSNLEVVRVPRTTSLPPSHLWYQLMNMNTLRYLSSDVDVVHGQDCSAFPMIYLCKRKDKSRPWVITVHTGPRSELYSFLGSARAGQASLREFISYVAGFPLWDLSIRGHARLADALVSVSESLMKEIANDYSIDRAPLSFIHTGVDVDNLESVARRSERRVPQNSGSDKVRLFLAGRFYWRKGVLHLLRSLAYLVHEFDFDSFRLEIFGRGPLETKIRQDILRLGIGRNVVMRGFAPYDEVIASMASSHVVCFPSSYEACPLGMIEAMALAKPVAAFDRPYSRELLGIDPQLPLARTTKEYARLLYSLCTSEDLRGRIGKRLNARARAEFDIKIIADKYSKLYRDISS